MTDRTGQHLGNYRLLRLLGHGGFADVYLGEHVYLQSQAALKLLHSRLSEEAAARFVTEARTLARLSHPHIVRVLDFAVHEGLPFLVMEYGPGGSLRTRHPAGTRLPLASIVSYVCQVAAALQYAHAQHFIHRDVKPENLLLGAREEVLLADFGLATLAPSSSRSTHAMEPPLNGTTAYLAPEQLQGKPRPASDQYALGVVVYEWLCGSRPFSGPPIQLAMQQLAVPPASLREQVPELPPAVEEVVLRALAKEPRQRFACVEDFANALQQAAQHAGSPVVAPGAAAEAFHPARTGAGAPATLTQQQADAQAVMTPNAVAAPQVEREQQESLADTEPPEPLWNVPASLTPLVGREQDVAAACALLSRTEVRLMTLLGAGGIGKTRLAMQVALQMRERYADGVCFVALAPISDPKLTISTIAHTLGIQQGGMQTLLEAVQAWLGDKQLLLLLDNFEQLVSAAPLLEELLAACPRLTIVVTSREVLHLQAEHLFPVPPLALPDLAQLPGSEQLTQYAAVALFVQRAQAIKPDFTLTQANGRVNAEICVRLDGLPLAIELAAARSKLLPPQALLKRLSHRLEILTVGAQDLPTRQQTLRDTLQWSYDLLPAQEQRLFRRLAVFVGGCTLETVEAVCYQTPDEASAALDEVTSLLDKSLLQVEQAGGEPRLQMLMTVREYALECLQASGEAELIQRAHAAYYLAWVEEVEPRLEGPQQAAWLQRLEQEHDNLRAAMQWSLERGEAGQGMEMALRLGGALLGFWRAHGHFSEGRIFLERALAGSGGTVASVRAKALIAAADVALDQGDYARGEVLCQESLALCRELEDTRGIAFSLRLLGWVAWNSGNRVAACSLMEEALALWREVGDKYDVAKSLSYLALLAGSQGEYSKGRALVEEGLALFRAIGDKRGVAWSLLLLAGILFSFQGDQAIVRPLLEEGLELCRALREKGCLAHALGILGQVTLDQGDATTARRLSEESLAIYREIGDRWGVIQSLCLLAQVEASKDDHVAARAHYVEGLVLCKEADDKWSTISCLEGLARVVAAQGEPAWAARLWGAAESLRTVIGALPQQGGLFWMAPLPVVHASSERARAAARAQLGEKAFAKAWAEGRAMTPEQALAVQGAAMIPIPKLAGASPARPAKVSPTYPAGLTAREVEILRLVVQGLTDAQVAEQLVISPRTVNWHLTSIYSKLGVSSRCAATRYALEHRVV